MPDLGQELRRRRHQIDLLELEFSRLAFEFSNTDQYDDEGSVTPIDWIRFNCHMTGPAAADLVKVGEHLDKLALSAQCVETGELGFAHLVVLARTADHTNGHFHESELLDKARVNSPGRLRAICWKYWHARNPLGFAAEQKNQIEGRELRLSGWADGTLTLSGILDAVGGAALRSALEPLALPLGRDDKRSFERRMADALVELASGGEQKANIQVTASIDMLIGLFGSEAADVLYAQPVCTETVRRLGCDNPITRVLFDAESAVIDVGRAKRSVEGPVRRALEARDGGCAWPGCQRPAKRCAAHHIVHWAHGGRTDLDNLVLLCHHHHTLVHEGGWQLIRAEGGRIMAVPPPGRFTPWVRGPDPVELAPAS
jgi:hypothetical protein